MIEWFICAAFVPAPNFPKLPLPIEIVKQYAVLPKKENEIKTASLRSKKKAKSWEVLDKEMRRTFRNEWPVQSQKCSKSEWPVKKQDQKPSKANSLYKSKVKISQKVNGQRKNKVQKT